MQVYSIRYFHTSGQTSEIALRLFDNHTVAKNFARIGLVSSDIVEVWAEGDLIARLFRDGIRAGESDCNRTEVSVATRAERRQALDEWDNEGGSVSRLT